MQAVLRRRDGGLRQQGKSVDFGCLRIDEDAHRVWVSGHEVELTLLEFKLLLALYENRDRVQTRGALLDGVWGVDVSITTRTPSSVRARKASNVVGFTGSAIAITPAAFPSTAR